MSWLADIAGKAEDLLNKIDQNAAVALNQVSEHSKSPRRAKQKPSTTSEESGNAVHIEHVESLAEVLTSGLRSSSSFPSLSLATNAPPEPNIKSLEKNGSSSASGRSSRSSSKNDQRADRKSKPDSSSLNRRSGQSSTAGTYRGTTDEDLLEFLNAPGQGTLDESCLLRNEIDSQAKEMTLLLKNHKQLQQDNEILKKKYDSLQKSALAKSEDKREHDLQDSAIQRAAQLESLVQDKNDEISRLTDRLDQALAKLQNTEELQSTQNRLEQVKLESTQLLSTNEELLKHLDSTKLQIEASEKKYQTMRDTIASLEKEYAVYKDKAKSILKSKDEMISSLKSRQNKDEVHDDASSGHQFLSEIGSMRNERELLNAEISQSRSYMETLKEETHRLEVQVSHYRSKNSELQSMLSKAKQRVNSTQEENLQLSQAISILQLDLEREKIDKKKLQDKYDLETTKSNLNVMSMSSSFTDSHGHSPDLFGSRASDGNPDETDQLRTRITALSQSLLEKQSLINNLSTGKQLLQINVERLHAQLHDLNQNSDKYTNDGLCTQSVVSSQPLYLSESPWDSRVATRVKRAYSHVDSLCCQFGLAMRQRPNLRFGFSVYVLLLHLWVFFILFSWSHHSTSPELQVHK